MKTLTRQRDFSLVSNANASHHSHRDASDAARARRDIDAPG
jgi:hypothetical protein